MVRRPPILATKADSVLEARADFSSTEFPPATRAEAVVALRTHDWASELQLMRELEAAEQEFCMPGIGITRGNGCFLHICPNHDGTAMRFYAGEGNLQRGSFHRDARGSPTSQLNQPRRRGQSIPCPERT